VAGAELMFRPALELAELLRAGEVTSRELVELSLERIEALDGALGAVVNLDAVRALDAADAIGAGDGRPFAGVPFAAKDLNAVAGLPLTMGSNLYDGIVPDADDLVVHRFRGSGLVVVGTTKTPEFGILPVTEPHRHGPARNPWDRDRTPGGSSGGAAAAVAAGLVPAAHGSDGGGSIRIPAACCGLVGLKVSRGRVPAPAEGDRILAVQGSLTRTVADTAALLDVVAGGEPGDPWWAPPAETRFSELATRTPGPLRIAATTTPPIDVPVDPICADAVDRAAELLSSLGHDVERSDPPWNDPALLPLFTAAFMVENARDMHVGWRLRGRDPGPADVEPLSWAVYRQMTTMSAVELYDARNRLFGVCRRLVQWMAPYDALLTPALAERPLPIGTIDTGGAEPLDAIARSGRFTPFTAAFNATGQPAISLPLFQGDDGLPLAVQLVGQPAGEGALLALAAQLEQAAPWHERRPPIAA
jgi:amidase